MTQNKNAPLIGGLGDNCSVSALNERWLFRDARIVRLLYIGQGSINFTIGWHEGCQNCHLFFPLYSWQTAEWLNRDGTLPVLVYAPEDNWQTKKASPLQKDIISSCQSWLYYVYNMCIKGHIVLAQILTFCSVASCFRVFRRVASFCDMVLKC